MIDAFSRKMPQSGGQNIFIENERTNKVPLIFWGVKVLSEREQLRF